MAHRAFFVFITVATLAMTGALGVSRAKAQSRIPVSIESTPPGATVYVDSDSSPPIGTTPIRVARIPRGQHVLIFKLDNHQDARLTVDVRRRRETFRVVMQALSTIAITAANQEAQGAAVVIDGEPKGNVPFRVTLKPGRHLVQVRREGHKTFQQWVDLEGAQVFTLPVFLERDAPKTGSILVAGDISGAPVYLDGEPRGATPTILDDVPEGEHVVEIKPAGRPAHRETVRVRAGERASITPQLRPAPAATGTLRVVTTPGGAVVTVDGESLGAAPATLEEAAPGEHIVEASAEGYQTARQTVTVESGKRKVVHLQLEAEAVRPGRVVVNATVDGAQVMVDGEEKGPPPVVIEDAGAGTHAIVVKAPGYEDFRTTCEVRPRQDCEVLAQMVPVGTPVRVESNARGSQFYVDGKLLGPVPWEGSVPVGSHRVEVRAPGYNPHVQQVELRPSSEPRAFNVALVREGEELDPEKRAVARQRRLQELREAASYSAVTLPIEMTVIDVSAGWPFLVELRLGVGIADWIEAGFAARTFGRLTEFEARTKVGFRPIRQLGFGAQLRFGGGIGPKNSPKMREPPDAMGEPRPDHPTNDVFVSLELLSSLHFSQAGAFTFWMGVDAYSDRWDFCGGNSNRFPDPDGGCFEPNAADETFERARQKHGRLRLGGALEIVANRRWNVWGLLEGIVKGPSRRILGDVLNVGAADPEIYGRLGFTYKFGNPSARPRRSGPEAEKEKPSDEEKPSEEGDSDG